MIEKKQIAGSVFIDTNVLIYAYSSDEPLKKTVVNDLFVSMKNIVISTQVINEFVNVLHKKKGVSFDLLSGAIDEIMHTCNVAVVDLMHVKSALAMAVRFKYSYFDSLILATALANNCKTLYSEDMQHGQVICDSLTIINPFKLKRGD